MRAISLGMGVLMSGLFSRELKRNSNEMLMNVGLSILLCTNYALAADTIREEFLDDPYEDLLYDDRYDYYYDDGYFEHDHDGQHDGGIHYRSCGSTVHDNNTILINPSYPDTYAGGSRCVYRIHRPHQHHHHRTCQIRIDFLAFSLAQPSGDGVCNVDYFTVEGGSRVPLICGENTGSHIYVELTKHLPVTVVVATTYTNYFNRRWQFRVTHIRCRSPLRAPQNCLQFYTESSGVISSFNYRREENGNFNSIGVTGSREIASLNYNICIRRPLAMCSVTYTRPTSDPYAFTLTGDIKSVDPQILGTLPLQSQECTTDYIVIPSPSQVVNGARSLLTANRFCGMGFGVVISQTIPFYVTVVTDLNETPDLANRGFSLSYSLGACFG